ncbi:MAG: hypothetical protein NVV73_07205 [Cellvibrionaceae bacterium]|nr:hypothetical protein [Cellvibrionaceae bacterium]
MKFTKLHLYMICLLSVTWSTHSIADWCEYEIEKEEDSPCQTGWGFPEQVHEYCDKAESKIRRACFTENPNKFDMEGALDKIVAHIQYQGGLKVGPERTEVVLKNAELSILNSLIKERSSTLLQLKSDASTTMKAVKTNSEGLGKQYETTLSTYIQQVNGTEDLNTLFKLKQAISNKNIEILGLVAAEHKKLVDANMAIEQAETMLIEAYAKLPEDTLSTLKLSDIRSGTGLLSTAIQWQIDLQYQMVSLTESIQSAVDQKMTIVRIKQREKNINDATKERLATAKRIALQSQHLSEIQGIIQQMTRGKKSSYLNMTYLGG